MRTLLSPVFCKRSSWHLTISNTRFYRNLHLERAFDLLPQLPPLCSFVYNRKRRIRKKIYKGFDPDSWAFRLFLNVCMMTKERWDAECFSLALVVMFSFRSCILCLPSEKSPSVWVMVDLWRPCICQTMTSVSSHHYFLFNSKSISRLFFITCCSNQCSFSGITCSIYEQCYFTEITCYSNNTKTVNFKTNGRLQRISPSFTPKTMILNLKIHEQSEIVFCDVTLILACLNLKKASRTIIPRPHTSVYSPSTTSLLANNYNINKGSAEHYNIKGEGYDGNKKFEPPSRIMIKMILSNLNLIASSCVGISYVMYFWVDMNIYVWKLLLLLVFVCRDILRTRKKLTPESRGKWGNFYNFHIFLALTMTDRSRKMNEERVCSRLENKVLMSRTNASSIGTRMQTLPGLEKRAFLFRVSTTIEHDLFFSSGSKEKTWPCW